MSENNSNKEDDIDIALDDIAESALADMKLEEAQRIKDKELQEKREKTVIPFKDKFEIYPLYELPEFSGTLSKACKVVDTTGASRELIGFICHKYLPPRFKVFRVFDSINNKCIGKTVGHGTIQWPDDEMGERYIMIYENIYGKCPMPDLKGDYNAPHEDVLVEKLIKPLTEMLVAFSERDFIHGAIRPNNLYENQLDGNRSYAVLPKMEIPLSSDQDVLFEPVELALCDPEGKGLGHKKNDLYSFGITIALMMLGFNPMRDFTDDEIIEAKITQGTYAALLGQQKIPSGINEVLRGLLCDDIDDRWSISDLESWVDGKRMTPRQSVADSRYDRGFNFRGTTYHHFRTLAKAMQGHAPDVMKIVDDESLYRWIERTLGHKEVAARVEMAVRTAPGERSDQRTQEALTSRIITALDPRGPVRFKNFSFLPEGIGMSLLKAMAEEKNVADFITILEQDLLPFWFSLNPYNYADAAAMISSLDACKKFLKQRVMGNGIERCLYYLNRDAPCLSPMFEQHFVTGAIDLVRAINDVGTYETHPKEPFDQHIAAYLTVHFSASNEGDIQLLGAADLKERYFAALTLHASLQRYGEIDALKGLGQWLYSLMEPVVNSFHSRDIRNKMSEDLKKIAIRGDLVGMYELLNDKAINKEDFIGFGRAQIEYKRLKNEYTRLSFQLSRDDVGMGQGKQIAAISSFLITIVGLLVFYMVRSS